MPHPADDPGSPRPEPTDLSVVVERSGGFAGLVRRWSVTAGPADSDRWAALIDACAWDRGEGERASGSPTGADRFCWAVTARTAAAEHHAALAEHEVDGPWRVLIDAVREADAARTDPDAASAPEQ